MIVGVRIGRNHRCASVEESLQSLSNKRRPMTDPDHFGRANVLVDPPRSFGKAGEMMVLPTMHGVVLHEREGLPVI